MRRRSMLECVYLLPTMMSVALVLLVSGISSADPCTPHWAQGLFPSDRLYVSVKCQCVYDDGSGPALYIAGSGTAAGNLDISNIVRWKDGDWQQLGSGINGDVCALCVYDDGSGPALYAGGSFTSAGGVAAGNIARWKNGAWEAVGSGTNSDVVGLCVYDDGSGSALYACGSFMWAGSVPASHIARWKNGTWQAVGGGMFPSYGSVYCLCVHDDGGGPALYAGGYFTTAGGVSASNIAKWRGGTWQALGAGANDGVGCLYSYNDGSGSALYAGGTFTTAGGVAAAAIARWRSGAWQAVGGGMQQSYGTYFSYPWVASMCAFDDGTGVALYAVGQFTKAGSVTANDAARWKNGAWQAVGSNVLLRLPVLGRVPLRLRRWFRPRTVFATAAHRRIAVDHELCEVEELRLAAHRPRARLDD